MGEIPVDEEGVNISEEIIKEYREEVSRKTIGVDIGLSELVSMRRWTCSECDTINIVGEKV